VVHLDAVLAEHLGEGVVLLAGFAAHSTSSNNRASQLAGVSRESSRPCRWTIARRGGPTSECTPRPCETTAV
jgi:hypothetical protein